MSENEYYFILTDTGTEKLTEALADGEALEFTGMAVGDGDGSEVEPTSDQTELVNEVYKEDLNRVYIDPDNSANVIAELIIPKDEGPFTVREVGLFDSDGDLIAVGNFPETYKPVATNGAVKDLVIRMVVSVTNSDSVELTVDGNVVTASQDWVKDNFVQTDDDGNAEVDGYVKAEMNQTEHTFEWSGRSESFPADSTDKKIYLHTGLKQFWGAFEVSIYDAWSNARTSGKLTKVFDIGCNSTTLYDGDSQVTQAIGSVFQNFKIGEPERDSDDYIQIPIYHISSHSNQITVHIKGYTAVSDHMPEPEDIHLTDLETSDHKPEEEQIAIAQDSDQKVGIRGKETPVVRLKHLYKDSNTEKEVARSELLRRNKSSYAVNLVLPGRLDIIAEGVIELKGFRSGVYGRWKVKQVRHEMDSSGCRLSVECIANELKGEDSA